MAIQCTAVTSASRAIYTTTNIQADQPRSVCVWFRVGTAPNADNDTVVFPMSHNGSSYHYGFGLKKYAGVTGWRLRLTDSNLEDYYTTEIQLNTWYHAGFSRADASPRTMFLYLNGVQVSLNTNGSSGLPSNTDPSATNDAGMYTSGVSIDLACERYREWTTVLTEAEFAAEKASSSLVKTANAVRNNALTTESDLTDTVNSWVLTLLGTGWSNITGPSFSGAPYSLSIGSTSYAVSGKESNLLHGGHGWLRYRKP